jgi:hypothetical protein
MNLDYLYTQALEEDMIEDLKIIQPDGSRACVNWELKGHGYHIDHPQEVRYLTDEELLESARIEVKKLGKRVREKPFKLPQ